MHTKWFRRISTEFPAFYLLQWFSHLLPSRKPFSSTFLSRMSECLSWKHCALQKFPGHILGCRVISCGALIGFIRLSGTYFSLPLGYALQKDQLEWPSCILRSFIYLPIWSPRSLDMVPGNLGVPHSSDWKLLLCCSLASWVPGTVSGLSPFAQEHWAHSKGLGRDWEHFIPGTHSLLIAENL